MKTIILTQGKFALVDDDVYEWASQYNWYYNSNGYAVRHDTPKRIMRLHHAVIGFPLNGNDVDHKNGNRLDNRRQNLSIVTRRQNLQNQKEHREGKLVGVTTVKVKYKNKECIYYRAQIRIDDKIKYMGYFKTPEEAHKRYLLELKTRGLQ